MGNTSLLESYQAPGTASDQIEEDAKHQELSDDEELYPASETFEVARLQLPPGSIAAPEVIAVSAADDSRLDAAQHPVEADLETRYRRMWKHALGQLEVL